MFSYFTWRWEIADVMGAFVQIIQTVARGNEVGGFDMAAEVLKRIGRNYRDGDSDGARLILVTVACPKHDFHIGLRNGQTPTIHIMGLERYAGFSLTCGLPPTTFKVDLEDDAVFGLSWRARKLFGAFQRGLYR